MIAESIPAALPHRATPASSPPSPPWHRRQSGRAGRRCDPASCHPRSGGRCSRDPYPVGSPPPPPSRRRSYRGSTSPSPWWLANQTVGDLIVGIMVLRPDGGELSLLHSALRAAIGLLLAPLWTVGLIAILWDPKRRAWHDKVLARRSVTRRGADPLAVPSFGPSRWFLRQGSVGGRSEWWGVVLEWGPWWVAGVAVRSVEVVPGSMHESVRQSIVNRMGVVGDGSPSRPRLRVWGMGSGRSSRSGGGSDAQDPQEARR